jgi:hypothetical protein
MTFPRGTCVVDIPIRRIWLWKLQVLWVCRCALFQEDAWIQALQVDRCRPMLTLHLDMSLGQLTVPLPPYLHAQHDESARKISVRVDDAAEKHQRAMWGKQKTLHSTCLRKDSSLRRHGGLTYSHH